MSEPYSKRPKPKRLVTWERLASHGAGQFDRSIDWPARSGGGRRLLHSLERLALWFEALANKLVGNLQLNPLYHTDTLAFFLLIVVGVSGLYLVVFYQFGYGASYESVAKMSRFPLSRLMRGVHRYGSAALMIFTLLHALRIFFLDRFRGARRPAWIWGVVTTVAIWIAGVTGYLLLWDQRAQLVVQSTVNLLEPLPALAAGVASVLLSEMGAEKSWLTMLVLLGLHIGLSALGGLFYWYHIQRLSRPKFFPARYWMIGVGLILAVLALVIPASLLPMADFAQVPGMLPLDFVYLFFVPLALKGSWIGPLLGMIALTALVAAIPWIVRRREPPRIEVAPELCVGCKLCAEDCPYGALTMQPRDDGSPYRLLAVVDQSRCVACGICIGSCNTMALGLGERPAGLLWQDVSARLKLAHGDEHPTRVVFAFERHVAHGARPYLRRSPEDSPQTVGALQVEVVPLTCAAMAHPGLLTRALEAGAAEVAGRGLSARRLCQPRGQPVVASPPGPRACTYVETGLCRRAHLWHLAAARSLRRGSSPPPPRDSRASRAETQSRKRRR